MTMQEAATKFMEIAYDVGNISVTTQPYAVITSSGSYQEHRRRLKCVYCDCISNKESGTCEHCGAPLIEDEY